jgi:hypothetical protein
MIRKLTMGFALVAGLLVTPQVSSSASASTQITVWKGTNLQQTASTYWEPPLNATTRFTDGRAFVKISVTGKPSNKEVQPAVCFWRDEGTTRNKYETCAATNGVTFTGTGTFYIDLGTPQSWWKKNGVYDWSKQASRGRIMIKNPGTSGKLLLASRCGQACYPGGLEALSPHVPITMSGELIFVAKGQKLACPSDWNTPLCGTGGGGGTTPPPTTPPPTTPPSPTTPPPTTPPPTSGLDVTITPGDRSLAVAWSDPVAKRFQVRYRQAGTSGYEWFPSETTNGRTITGLVNGRAYEVEVRKYVHPNWQPWSTFSGTPNGTGGSATTAPPAPTPTPAPTPAPGGGTGTVSVPATNTTPALSVAPSSGQLAATWSHPSAKLFQFRYSTAGSTQWNWDQPAQTTSRTVTGLTNGQAVTVEVRAYVNGNWRAWASVQATPGS